MFVVPSHFNLVAFAPTVDNTRDLLTVQRAETFHRMISLLPHPKAWLLLKQHFFTNAMTSMINV
jgi:hypothetical protein